MPKPLEFWFEFASTYSYPAAMRIEEACADAGVPLIWRSFLLGPIFCAQGMTTSPFNMFPVKGAYMWRDMERICEESDIGFVKPSSFPRGSILAARIAARHGASDWIGPFVRAVYTANFSDNRDIGDDAVIGAILEEIGLEPAAILAETLSPEGKAVLRKNTDEAQVRGLFGAPTLMVGDELFWGHDRLEQAIDWALRD